MRFFSKRRLWMMLVIMAASYFFLLTRGGEINFLTFRRVSPGMTEEEVKVILGTPRISTTELHSILDMTPDYQLPEGPKHHYWSTNYCCIVVDFDENRRAIKKHFCLLLPAGREMTWFDRLKLKARGRLGIRSTD